MAASDIVSWVNIPAGSRLEVSVTAGSDSLIAGADIFVPQNAPQPTQQWGHKELCPGPRVLAMPDRETCEIDVRVANGGTAAGTGTVTVRLLASDGSVLAGPRVLPFQVAPGTHYLAKILLAPALPAAVAVDVLATPPVPRPAAPRRKKTTGRRPGKGKGK
jgi:hypothetical protein